MYDLRPPRIFVHKRVYRNPRAVRRLERMLAALGNPPFEEVDTSDTDRVIEATGSREDLPVMSNRVRQGIEKRQEDPVFLFNTFVWEEPARSPVRRQYKNVRASAIARLMAGTGEDFVFGRREASTGRGDKPYVCQGGWSIHSLLGCVHKCDYCGQGYIVNFMLDVEDFADRVYDRFWRRPQQKLYRYDLKSDSICFEPEYGASAILSETFSRTDDKFLLYYTKSDNVDHLLDLPKDHSIFYLTLSTDTVSRVIERDTPPMDARIEALRKCEQAGYVVRVGFSPIVPIRNWRRETTECLERLFANCSPDTVRLWVVSMMSAEEAEILFDVEMLDPQYVEAMRRAAPEMNGKHSAPFPAEVRAEIYGYYIDEIKRISPDTPVSICTEERRVWEMLAHKLSMKPDDLFCCCGATSVPRA